MGGGRAAGLSQSPSPARARPGHAPSMLSPARVLASLAAPGQAPSRVAAELLALVAPPRCLACGDPLGRADQALCTPCRAALPWLHGLRCPRCALPVPCGPCPAARAAFASSWSPVAHAGPARALVGALKFRGVLAAADLMAA